MHYGKETDYGQYVRIDLEPDDDDYEDDIPEGCLACGGDYPLCRQGCPLYDD